MKESLMNNFEGFINNKYIKNVDCYSIPQFMIELLDKNSKKDLINIVSEFVPRSFARHIIKKVK